MDYTARCSFSTKGEVWDRGYFQWLLIAIAGWHQSDRKLLARPFYQVVVGPSLLAKDNFTCLPNPVDLFLNR